MTNFPTPPCIFNGSHKNICVFILCKDNNSQSVYLCLQTLNFKMSKPLKN